MKYNSEIHHRHSIRLRDYDYSQIGAYFITICTHDRNCLFGNIIDDKMLLNEFGMLVHGEWIKSAQIRMEIKIDEFIVMPNHIHGIVIIDRKGDRPVAPTIGSLIGGFKSTATKQINEIRKMPRVPVWQRNYYEHIIRNEKSLYNIREYIVNNPLNWKQDEMYKE